MSVPSQIVRAASSAWSLLLLGTPRLVRDDGSAVHVLERRDAAMLARVALQGPQARDALAEWTWPEVPREKAMNSLRQRLFRLRRLAGIELMAGPQRVALSTGVTHDLAPLLERDWSPVAAGEDGPAHPARDAEFLDGCDYRDEPSIQHWVDEIRSRWRLLRRDGLLRAAGTFERASKLARAIESAEAALQLDPLNEGSHALLMRLRYLDGDTVAALAAYERCSTMLRDSFDAEPSPATRELSELIRRGAMTAIDPAPMLPVAMLRPPRLVGRDVDMARLRAASRSSGMVAIVGEAGIGKSRFLAEFARSIAAPDGEAFRVAMGDHLTPLGVLGSLTIHWMASVGCVKAALPAEVRACLEAVQPATRPAGPAAVQQPPLVMAELRAAVARLLRLLHEGGKRWLLIDDLQFADEATQAILLEAWLLASSDESAHVHLPRLICAFRAGAMAACWDRVREVATPSQLHVLALQPWPVAAVRDLLEDLRQCGIACDVPADALARQAGGVPLLVLELIRAGILGDGAAPGAAPPLALMARRVEQLPPPAQRLLRVAALAGSDFDAALAAQVLGCHVLDLVEAWRSLEQAQMLSEGRITSDTLTEAVRAGMPGPIAATLHESLARALQAREAAAAVVALHWERSGHWPEAAKACEEAARVARQRACRAEELALLARAERAWSASGRADDAFRCGLASVDAAAVVDTPDKVDALLDRLAGAADTQAKALDVLLARVRHCICKADLAGALEPAGAALSLAKALGDDERQAAAAGWLGLALCSAGKVAPGRSVFSQHRQRAEAAAPRVRLDFFSSLGYAMYLVHDYQEGSDATRRALAVATQLDDASEIMVQAINLSVIAGALGQRGDALSAAQAAHLQWERLGRPGGVDAAGTCLHLASLYLAEGRYRDAGTMLDWCRSQFISGNAMIRVAQTEFRIARLYLRLGQPQKARQAMRPLPADAPTGTTLARAVVECRIDQCMLGRVPPRKLADLQLALAQAGDDVALADRVSALLLASSLSEPAEALGLAQRAMAEAEHGADQPARLSALNRLAEAHRGLGELQRAVSCCREAMQLARGTLPLDAEVVETWWIGHQVLAQAGLRDESSRALQEAIRWIDQARPHVPPEFVDSFLHRNLLHRQIIGAAAAARVVAS